MNIIYEKDDNNYHGGYCIEPFTHQQQSNKYDYLGGNHKTNSSQFDKIVVPFGLFYRNRSVDLNNDAIHTFMDEHHEPECVEPDLLQPDLFDRLFYAVGRVEISKKDKHKKNKTRKLHV